MAFKVINNFIGVDGFIFTLLVFGAYLYIIKSNTLNPIVIKQAAVFKKAIKEVKKFRAEY